MPSTASSTAFTTPPKRVAIPPARTTWATSPRRSASTPAALAASWPGSPGPGQRRELLLGRRLEHASDQVRLGRKLARCDPRAEPIEELLVEPELFEDGSDLRADALDHEAAPTEVGRDET